MLSAHIVYRVLMKSLYSHIICFAFPEFGALLSALFGFPCDLLCVTLTAAVVAFTDICLVLSIDCYFIDRSIVLHVSLTFSMAVSVQLPLLYSLNTHQQFFLSFIFFFILFNTRFFLFSFPIITTATATAFNLI